MKKRLMCMILSILMLVSILPIGALADDGGTEETQTTASATESTETGTTPIEDATEEVTETTTEATTEPANTVTSGAPLTATNEIAETEAAGETTSSAVAKIGSQTYESLSAAISAATSGDTVELLDNVTLDAPLEIFKSITLALGDYTITSRATGKAIYTTQSLTITANANGGISASGYAVLNQKGSGTGTLIIDGGTYTSSADHAIYNLDGTVTIESGTISTTYSEKAGIYNTSGGTVTVNGGSVSGVKYGIYSSGDVVITDGTITGTAESSSYGVYLASGATATISGGTIKGYEGLRQYVGTVSTSESNSVDVVISDGTFEGVTHAVNVCTTATVSGGTFTATGTKDQYAVALYSTGAAITVSGGTFSGMYSTAWINSGSNGTITIADGYAVNTGTLTDSNSGDTALVRTVFKTVASVTSGTTTTYYETFDEAIAAATTDGDTITLLSDATWTLTANQTFTIGLTFDLNGHTLTLYSSSNDRYVTFNPSSSESTVAFVDNSTTGGGKVIGSCGSSYGLIRIKKACSVVLKNVTFENTSYGYAIELGNSSYDLNITAENCTFVNSNTTNKSSSTSSTIYSRSALVYGNKGTDTTKKISFYGCTFKTESTNGGAALQIQGGADGTNSVITIDNCQIISNGTSTSAYALYFSTNLNTKVDITNSIIQAASGACAANFAYSIKSTANLTFGEGNTVTGMLRFGNSSSPVYVINVTGGCFSYTVDGVETNPFVAATATESAVSVSSLLNLTGGYFKTSVFDVVANGYTILANTQEAAGDSYNSGYADVGYDYVVTSAANATGYYTVSNGMPNYYQSLESALSNATSGDTVYFATDCELSSTDISYINDKNLTITNHGSVTITYGGTLSELVSALKSGTVSVQTLAYKYDDTTNHSMTNAVIANGELTGGLLPDMVYTDSGIWNYYNDSTLLTESYVICRGSYGWTIASASSKYAAKVDNIYFSDYYLGEAVSASIKLNALDSSTHVVTLVDNATCDIEVSTAGATLVLDLGGYTLSGHVYLLQNNITATICNGSIVCSDSSGMAIYTNGTYTGMTLTLDNVTITDSNGYGMYLAGDTTTTINNCSITGASTGIEVRAGDLTITSSTVTSTTEEFGTVNNNSGTTVIGAGIAVSQHTTNHEINVTITDSEISGYYGIFEVNYNSSNTSEVNINISGDSTKVTGTGTGAAAIYSVSVRGTEDESISATQNSITTVAVSGGSFSSEVLEAYCATGYEPTEVQDDETYSVKAKDTTLGISDNNTDVVIAEEISQSEDKTTMYAEVKAENISGKYDVDSYPTTSLTYTEGEVEHNYIFAGWYTASTEGDVTTYTACSKSMWTDIKTSTTEYYAKFVDANVLSSGAQILDTTTSESETTAIRFVSTVDDLDYIKVGFVIHITGKGTATVSTTSVYQKILGSDGETELSYEPTCFSSASQYFDVYTLTGVPNEKFSSTITVTAYWVTLDGTTVYGSPYQFTINDKIAELNNTSQG